MHPMLTENSVCRLSTKYIIFTTSSTHSYLTHKSVVDSRDASEARAASTVSHKVTNYTLTTSCWQNSQVTTHGWHL